MNIFHIYLLTKKGKIIFVGFCPSTINGLLHSHPCPLCRQPPQPLLP